MAEVPITYEGFASPFLEDRYDRFGAPIVQDIDNTTMDAVIEMVNEGLRRGYSPLQIANGVEEEKFDGVASIFDDDNRNETIARTETMFALNWGAGSSFADSGVSHVEAMDGGDDPECAARDGQIFEIDPDTGVVVDETGEPVRDHPNGTLAFAPYITDDVVEGGALDDTGDVVSAETELGAVYEVKHGTGQTNNPRGGNQHGAGPKIPRKHTHQNGVTHRHIGGARPHKHGSRVIPADSPAYRSKEGPHGRPLAETKYSEEQSRDERGRWASESGSGAAWAATLPDAQREAIHNYTGNGYGTINGVAREGNQFGYAVGDLASIHEQITQIDQAISTAPSDARVVYRGMNASVFTGVDEGPENATFDWKSTVGTSFVDKGFVSTSESKDMAGLFAGMRGNSVLVELHVPEGIHAAPASYFGTSAQSGVEREQLLERGLTYHVDSFSADRSKLPSVDYAAAGTIVVSVSKS